MFRYGYDYPRYTLSKIFGGNDALYGLPLQFPSTASYPKATSEPVATSLSPSPPLKSNVLLKNILTYIFLYKIIINFLIILF